MSKSLQEMIADLQRKVTKLERDARIEASSRAQFVARLSSGDMNTMMSCHDVVGLLSDCDMLAQREHQP